jgi:polysaccharide chain length determinant protein (PEP-CTERM system associated)
MGEILGQLLTVARGMWKHRWLGLIAAWLVTAIGAIVVLSVPDKYEASARIFVDTQSILKPLMSGLAIQPNIEQQVAMLSRTLINRPNVEKLVRMADLDLGSSSKSEQDALVDGLMRSLEIKNVGRDNLYLLAYRDSSPDQAKRVIQSLVSIFVESSLGNTRKDSDSAKKFIDDQISSVVVKLEDAEARLKEFKVRNIELKTADGRDMTAQLSAVGDQLSQARLELREAENARDSARRQLELEQSQSVDVTTRSLLQESATLVSTPEIDARIEAQKRNLDALLQRFTEQHPDVGNTRRLIKDLDEIKRKEVAEARKIAMSMPMTKAPNSLASQELTRMLATSEVQVAALQARVREYESRFARARELMKTAPQIEAEYSQLNRDYDVHKRNYSDLVARRESASLSGDLDTATGVADFRLIDPPRVSPKPVAPNRLLLLPLALLAGLGAGLGLAFVLSQVRPVFYDGLSLRSAVGLPLLGVVTFVSIDGSTSRDTSDLKKFFGAFFGLFITFGAGMVIFSLLAERIG